MDITHREINQHEDARNYFPVGVVKLFLSVESDRDKFLDPSTLNFSVREIGF
jgi:hypothetical protein